MLGGEPKKAISKEEEQEHEKESNAVYAVRPKFELSLNSTGLTNVRKVTSELIDVAPPQPQKAPLAVKGNIPPQFKHLAEVQEKNTAPVLEERDVVSVRIRECF